MWKLPVPIGFLTAAWAFPLAVTLHEFEEWNIIPWYRRNYVDLPPLTDRGIRAWIVFSSVLAFLWTGAAVLPGNPALAAWALLLAFALMSQNALLHVYWLFRFRQYAPGVVTSAVLLMPAIAYLAAEAVQEGYVPSWYIAVLIALQVPGLAQAVRAGNRMLPSFRALHAFGDALAKRFT